MIEPPKFLATVTRSEYDHLRRILPDLPQSFLCWVEQRYAQRQQFESCCRRYAELKVIQPAEFARYCMKAGRTPTLELLDDWATLTSCQLFHDSERPQAHPQ